MVDEIITRDENRATIAAGITDDADQDITMLRVDAVSSYLLADVIASPGAAVGAGDGIANRDENRRTVVMAWDDTNQVLQEVLTDANGYILCDLA